MKNTVFKKTSNAYELIHPFFLSLLILSASLVIGSTNAEMLPNVQVTKIHQKFVEEGKASVAFTLCSGSSHLTLPKFVVSSDLQTKNLSLKHDLRPNTCIGGTTVINVHDVSTITASIESETNIMQSGKIDNPLERLVYQGMSNDDSLRIEITSEEPAPDTNMKINIKFTDMLGNLVTNVNYDITALQDGHLVLSIKDLHSARGSDIITTQKLFSDSNVEFNVMIHGIGLPGNEEEWTGPKGEVIMVHAIPEFGTIAIFILAASILGILAVSIKHRSLMLMKISH